MQIVTKIAKENRKLYLILRKFYRIFFGPFFLFSPIRFVKKLIYNLEKDLEHNTKIFIDLNFDVEKIKSQLKSYKLNYNDYHLSWHYHLFSGLSQKLKKIKILEIGTHRGEFTSFLSHIFSDSEIITIDLPQNDSEFISSYQRNDISVRKNYLDQRKINLSEANIQFLELDSINIIKKFKEKKFDLIWVDGDHLNPQVSIDIIQSIQLLNRGGILLCDDVIKKSFFSKYTSSESFETLELLSKKHILKNKYLFKRINKNNSFVQKYISLSVKTTV